MSMTDIKKIRSSDNNSNFIPKSPEPVKSGSPMRGENLSPFSIKSKRKTVR